MNLHEDGNEEILSVYCNLAATCDRLTVFTGMLAEWNGYDSPEAAGQLSELLRLNVECAASAVNAAYSLHEVMEGRINLLTPPARDTDSG